MRRLRRFSQIFAVVAVLGMLPAAAWSQAGGATVGDVLVEGAQRIEADTIRSYLLIQKGDPFDAERIDRSLKSLFATGLYADVSIRRQGNNLVVTVVENPVINRVAFEGNKKIGDETLTAEITLRPRVIYTRTKVQNDVRRILQLYRRSGRFAATVEPKVIRLAQNRIDLVFEINEGEATAVQKIRFVGNKEFSDSKLREAVRTKESRWYRFLSSDDTYDPDRLTLDRELLRQFYLRKGYADFRVVSAVAELTPDRKDFFITFTIDEGNRYKFGKIDIEVRLRGLNADEVKDVVEVKSGDWYNAKDLETTIDELANKISGLGFNFVDVRPRIDRDRDKRTIAVAFEVNEGPRVFVERIDIVGNVRTQDRVIRREFRLAEGDAFNVSKLRRSRQRMSDLDFFQKVNIEEAPGSAPDKTIIKTEVEEKSTGQVSLGAGFSTSSGLIGDISLRERNLLGRGQDLRLGLRLASLGTLADVSFTEPYFLDRDIAAGFDVFRSTRNLEDQSSHDLKTTGGSLRMGYPFTERLRQAWRYTFKKQEIFDVEDGASALVRQQEGSEWVSEIGHGLSYDRRDSAVSPTTGYLLRMNNDFAGVGGTERYVRNRVSAAKYFSLEDDWVLSVRGTAGQIVGLGEDVSLSNRFFVGGDDLRGFETGGIGPRDKITKDALGAEWMYVGTVELIFPLGLPAEFGVKGKAFTDFGSAGKIEPTNANVGDTSSVRVSVGTGLLWASPFGPLGIDLGIPVLKESFDKKELIRVNFGTRF